MRETFHKGQTTTLGDADVIELAYNPSAGIGKSPLRLERIHPSEMGSSRDLSKFNPNNKMEVEPKAPIIHQPSASASFPVQSLTQSFTQPNETQTQYATQATQTLQTQVPYTPTQPTQTVPMSIDIDTQMTPQLTGSSQSLPQSQSPSKLQPYVHSSYSCLTLVSAVETESLKALKIWLTEINPVLVQYAQILDQEGFDQNSIHLLNYQDLRELGFKMAHAKLLKPDGGGSSSNLGTFSIN